jgi:hypothetical protein
MWNETKLLRLCFIFVLLVAGKSMVAQEPPANVAGNWTIHSKGPDGRDRTQVNRESPGLEWAVRFWLPQVRCSTWVLGLTFPADQDLHPNTSRFILQVKQPTAL